MSIGTRKAGTFVACTTCGRSVVVPRRSEPLRRDEAESGSARRPPWEESTGRAERPVEDAAPRREPFPGPARLPEHDRAVADDKTSLRLSRREGEEELDLTPMVDVTFLLLIFFMLTASYTLQKTFELPHSQPEQQAARQAPTLEELENENVLVRIEADNSILVDDEQTSEEQLVARIRQARGTGRPGLVIVSDHRSLHETTVRVIDAASAVGMERVQLAVPSASQ